MLCFRKRLSMPVALIPIRLSDWLFLAVPLSTGVDGLASEKWFDESEVVVPEG